MVFDRVIGQKRVKQIFEASLNRNRLAHAYLFHGQPGVGKDAMAISLAMSLNCVRGVVGGCGECSACSKILNLEYSDFRIVLPVPTRPKTMSEKKYREILRERSLLRVQNSYQEVSYNPEMTTFPVIGIDQIRTMKREVMLKVIGKRYRVFILSHADRLTTSAANSLLKLLEEPPEGTLLFLTTSIPGQLLPTIISRCQIIRFDLLLEEEIEDGLVHRWNIHRERARLFARMAGGSLQRALSLADEKFEEQREAAIKFLKISMEEDALLRIDGIDDFLKRWDKLEFQNILQILLVWLHDLFHLHLGSPKKVMNVDRMEQLEKFREQWPGFDAEAGMKSIVQAIDFIDKNVYLKLIIFFLNQELGKCINGKDIRS